MGSEMCIRDRNKFVLSVQLDRCNTWSKDGALLLGDAAHTMNPVAAQGINIALRDAIVAANHLIPLLLNDPTHARLDQAFGDIERERLSEVRQIQGFQKKPTTLLKRQNLFTLFMITNLPWITRLKFVQKELLKLADMMAYGVTKVELKV